MRLINADDLFNRLYGYFDYFNTKTIGVDDLEILINGMPTVDTERHGHWDYYGYDEISNVHIYRCSECECGNREATDYCAYCGAKMDEVIK